MNRSCIFLFIVLILASGLFSPTLAARGEETTLTTKKFRLSNNVISSDLAEYTTAGIKSCRRIFQQLSEPDHELGNDIIECLNNDLCRSRVYKAGPAFPVGLFNLSDILPLLKSPEDATSQGSKPSYYFSSTDFHRFIFRLKPF